MRGLFRGSDGLLGLSAVPFKHSQYEDNEANESHARHCFCVIVDFRKIIEGIYNKSELIF